MPGFAISVRGAQIPAFALSVMEFNLPNVDTHRLQVLCDAVDLPPLDLVEGLAGFVTGLALEVGLAAQPDVDRQVVAADSMQMAMIANNPRLVTIEDCLAIRGR